MKDFIGYRQYHPSGLDALRQNDTFRQSPILTSKRSESDSNELEKLWWQRKQAALIQGHIRSALYRSRKPTNRCVWGNLTGTRVALALPKSDWHTFSYHFPLQEGAEEKHNKNFKSQG